MSKTGDLVLAVRATGSVVARRVQHGPAQPNWSVGYEVLQEVVRRMWSREIPLSVARASFDDIGSTAPRIPGLRLEQTTLGGRPAEWVVPEGAGDQVLLYLHGGVYEVGSPRSHRALTIGLAHRLGARVVALDYRLAPEHACPAAIDDAVAAVRALIADGVAPEKLFIGGDSAGGGLTIATLVALRDAGDPLPAGAVLFSPWLDLTAVHPNEPTDYIRLDRVAAKVAQYAGALEPTDPRVSPLFAALAGLPPMLVIAGGAETLLPDSERFAAAAESAGVSVELLVEPGEVHVYPIFARINPRGAAALDRVAAFIRR